MRPGARRLVAQLLFALEQQPAGPIERVVAPAPMTQLFDLDPPADGVEGAVGQCDHVEGVDHLGRFGKHDAVDGGIGGRHVEGAVFDALLPGLGLFVQPGGHLHVVAAGQDVDDLVVLDIGHGGGVVGPVPRQAHEGGLVEADGGGLVQALAIGLEKGLAIGGHGVVDRVPVTGQLGCHLFDRASVADLARRPLGRPAWSTGISWPQCGGRGASRSSSRSARSHSASGASSRPSDMGVP